MKRMKYLKREEKAKVKKEFYNQLTNYTKTDRIT